MELCYTPFDQAAQALGIPVAVGEPMSRHTTFQIGGPADRFAAVETLPQLKALLQALGSPGLPYLARQVLHKFYRDFAGAWWKHNGAAGIV